MSARAVSLDSQHQLADRIESGECECVNMWNAWMSVNSDTPQHVAYALPRGRHSRRQAFFASPRVFILKSEAEDLLCGTTLGAGPGVSEAGLFPFFLQFLLLLLLLSLSFSFYFSLSLFSSSLCPSIFKLFTPPSSFPLCYLHPNHRFWTLIHHLRSRLRSEESSSIGELFKSGIKRKEN